MKIETAPKDMPRPVRTIWPPIIERVMAGEALLITPDEGDSAKQVRNRLGNAAALSVGSGRIGTRVTTDGKVYVFRREVSA